MQNIFIDILPPWVETGLQPAFYDLESGTVLQQTARMYAKVRELTEGFNTFTTNVANEINRFETETNNEIERFENATDAEIKRFEGVINDTVEEYIGKFNELHDYVEDYFDNLDVQEEINNKLDKMVDDGVLQEIITTYIKSNVAWTFDNVNGMQSATNLTAGSYAQTLGFYSIDDGGKALYNIRAKEENEVADGKFTLDLNDNSLIAELVVDGSLIVNQIGCKGDGVFDNTSILNDVLSKKKVKKIEFVAGQTYLCKSAITITKEFIIDGNFATLLSNESGTAFTVNIDNEDGSSVHEAYFGTIERLKFEAPSADTVFNNQLGYKGTLRNCYFSNFYGIGLRHTNGYEMLYENLRFWAKGTSATGIRSLNNDIHFNNIFMCDCHTGLSLQGSANFINNFHAWIFTAENYEGSKCIALTGNGINYVDQVYIDSYNYGIYYTGYGCIVSDEIFVLYNKTFIQSLADQDSCVIYYTSDTATYDYKTSLKNILISGADSNYTKFSNILPENAKGTFEIIASADDNDYNYNTHAYSLTASAGVTIKSYEAVRDANNLVHIRIQATVADATTGYKQICALPSSLVPKNYLNMTCMASTSEYMTNPYPLMAYLSTTVQVSFVNTGTQTVYIECTYLAKNKRT